ncbi:MAG: 6-bladed beta-propeller [Candidatus Aminicenantes bacterium]|nr:6-bladed beta-propeller [Candidatus Aminicenantes bacterium]
MRVQAAGIFAVLLGIAAFGRAQIIENPEKPPAPNAGRVLKLQEVWRVTDASGTFFFRYPNKLKIAEDGSIFLADREELLKFSVEGVFLKNFFKKGQGPGEIGSSFTYIIAGHELYVKDYSQRRIFRMALNGRYIDQLNLEQSRDNLIGVRDDGYLFIQSVWPPAEEMTGKLLPILDTVKLVSKDGKTAKDLHTFRTRWYMALHAQTTWDLNIEALSDDRNLLFGSHSREYLIEVLEIAKAQIVARFTRRYRRVRHTKEKWEDDFRKQHGLPEFEYESDVLDLLVNRDRLWIKTSTAEKEKGDFYDVFDFAGRYLDCFWLGAGRTLLGARGDEIFVTEKRADESLVFIKYKIVE